MSALPYPEKLKDNEVEIKFFRPENWEKKIYAYVYSEDGKELKPWPGMEMKYIDAYFCSDGKDKGFYSLIFPLQSEYLHHVVFSDGKQQLPSDYEEGFPAVTGYYSKKGFKGLKICTKYGISAVIGAIRTIYYKPRDDWKKVYAHYYSSITGIRGTSSNWTHLPGEKMYKIKNGNYVLYVGTNNDTKVIVAFNDGNTNENERRWDNNHGQNFEVDTNNQKNTIIHTI